MAEQQGIDFLLTPFRALDLTDEKGFLCGKILGDLGADVIKIEPPRGDPARNIGPFYHDIPHPEKSLYWFAFNTSKRGITLNIETRDGQEIFKKLASTADFVIESFAPGYMDRLGLGYSVLSEINPRIIMTSITPFGQDGPYKGYKASDIVALAMGGLMYICGDLDRAPLRCSVEQAYPQASAQAAMGTIAAHYYRELTGEGQRVDVSMQECVMSCIFTTQHFWDLNKTILKRHGSDIFRGNVWRRTIYPCKDGYISWMLMVAQMSHSTRALREWMASEGMAGDIETIDWEALDASEFFAPELAAYEEAFTKFFLTHTKAELHEGAIERGIILMPSNSIKDVLKNRQLRARDFWVEVEHPELEDCLVYPGAPFKLSEAPWKISRRAPLIGEHNEEIYEKELGFSKEQLSILKQGNVI